MNDAVLAPFQRPSETIHVAAFSFHPRRKEEVWHTLLEGHRRDTYAARHRATFLLPALYIF